MANAYQRGRPSYPAEAVDRLVDYLDLTEASTVLDLAAGTGQLSRLLEERVGHIIAVEPSAPMRARITADLCDVSALDGTAESIPLADTAVDAVVVGEAFHWFDAAAAAAEIARVLTEHGGLALLWNTAIWTTDNTPWLDSFRRVVSDYKRAAGSYPAGDGEWRTGLERSGLFEPLIRSSVEHVQTLTPAGFLAQVASWSWIANLADEHRDHVLGDAEAVVREYGEIAIPYRTDLYLTRRTGSGPPDAAQ